MITIRTGNYTPQEKALIRNAAYCAAESICHNCPKNIDESCKYTVHIHPCPYKHIIDDFMRAYNDFPAPNLIATSDYEK